MKKKLVGRNYTLGLITWVLKLAFDIIAELRRPEGPSSEATYTYRKEKKTHELIFSWLSWLAVLLMGAYARRTAMATESRKMTAILQLTVDSRETCTGSVCNVALWDLTSMLWSIDTYQNKVSTDRITWPYRGLKFRAHRGHVFFDVDRWSSAGFRLIRGLMSGQLVVNRVR